MLEVAPDPQRGDFGPTPLAERLEKNFGVQASLDTMKRWMLENGLENGRARRGRPITPYTPLRARSSSSTSRSASSSVVR